MTIAQTRDMLIKKRANNITAFIKLIFESWQLQFKIITVHSQPHGGRWPEFLCVEAVEALTCAAAMMKQIVLNLLR